MFCGQSQEVECTGDLTGYGSMFLLFEYDLHRWPPMVDWSSATAECVHVCMCVCTSVCACVYSSVCVVCTQMWRQGLSLGLPRLAGITNCASTILHASSVHICGALYQLSQVPNSKALSSNPAPANAFKMYFSIRLLVRVPTKWILRSQTSQGGKLHQ